MYEVQILNCTDCLQGTRRVKDVATFVAAARRDLCGCVLKDVYVIANRTKTTMQCHGRERLVPRGSANSSTTPLFFHPITSRVHQAFSPCQPHYLAKLSLPSLSTTTIFALPYTTTDVTISPNDSSALALHRITWRPQQPFETCAPENIPSVALFATLRTRAETQSMYQRKHVTCIYARTLRNQTDYTFPPKKLFPART